MKPVKIKQSKCDCRMVEKNYSICKLHKKAIK